MSENENNLNSTLNINQNEAQHSNNTKEETTQTIQQVIESNKSSKETQSHQPLSKEAYIEKYGSEDGYKSPEDWQNYGKAYSEVKELISGLKQAVHDRDKKIDVLLDYNNRIEQRVKERTLREIDADLKRAKENMDVDAVEKLTQAKQQANYDINNQQLVARENERQEALAKFQERNKHWFNINQDMMKKFIEFNNEVAQECTNSNVVLPMDQIAKIVEIKMKGAFPEAMLSQNSGASAPVISGINNSRSENSNSYAEFDRLSSQHKQIYDMYYASAQRKIAAGTQKIKPKTKQEFIQELKKNGEI